MNEKECTEQYRGIIMLRKGRVNDEDMWFATVGNQLVSDGIFKTKEALTNNLENLSLERICKIISGAFGRAIELSTKNEKQ